jgi:dihydroxyacetone kinase-like protein
MAVKSGQAEVVRMLNGAVEQIRRNHEMLSRLDAAVGDGDHGTTILRAMEAVAKVAAEPLGEHFGDFFSRIAWAVMSCDGGSTGPLLGGFFGGVSDAAVGKSEFTDAEWVTALVSGIRKLHQQCRANIGDKTMMDAFLPALEVLQAADLSQGLQVVLAKAAQAAARGAEATRGMKARFGRARNLGDRVIGHPDPGAVSASLILNKRDERISLDLGRPGFANVRNMLHPCAVRAGWDPSPELRTRQRQAYGRSRYKNGCRRIWSGHSRQENQLLS